MIRGCLSDQADLGASPTETITIMQFNAEQYYHVSLERMKQATRLYQDGTAYALAMYCGGLAVESLLRAFRWTHDSSFEGRHNLTDLLKESRLLSFDEEFMRRRGRTQQEIDVSGLKLRSAVNEVVALWHNNLRFASEASLKLSLQKSGKLGRIKGDAIKKNTSNLLVSAQAVVDRGAAIWISQKKL